MFLPASSPGHPRYAIAHTSPWYLIVDGQPIRSAEDGAYFADLLEKRLAVDLPLIANPRIRAVFETMAEQALRRLDSDADSAGRSSQWRVVNEK